LDQIDRVGAKLPIFDLFSLVAPQPQQLCENCQGQSCKAFIGLTIRAKMIGGGRPLLAEILSQSDSVGAKFEQAAITPKRYEIGRQLLLITNNKSHTGFRLVPTSMTLNDLEPRNSPYFAFFSRNSTDFQADYITVVEDRPIMSVKYVSAVSLR